MADSVQVAVYSGGELKVNAQGEAAKEVVLALPLGRLIVKILRVDAAAGMDAEDVARPLLQSMSPYPDAPLTVGVETLAETGSERLVLAAALPEDAAGDIGDALDSAKVFPVRIDALCLGVLRERWGEIVAAASSAPLLTNQASGDGAAVEGDGQAAKQSEGQAGVRRVVLIREVDDVALAVLDGEVPVVIKALGLDDDMKRSVMLALLEAEDFGGGKPLAEIVTLGDVAADGLEAFAPCRAVGVADDAGVFGVGERALEEHSLNALPESWREELDKTRFKAKLTKFLAVAGGIWLLVMGVLFGVPVVYGYMTDHQKALMKDHARKYNEVKEMREKVRLVQKYSDHSRGALEIMKAVSDRLPAGIELTSWNFKREDGVKFSGEALAAPAVYQLKNDLLEMAEAGEDGERIFADVRLTGPTKAKGKERFDIECLYEKAEE